MSVRRRSPAVLAKILFALVLASAGTATGADLEVFSRAGCPRCTEAKRFLRDLSRERPDFEIVVRDVGEDPVALAELRSLVESRGLASAAVPTFRVGEEVVVGFLDAETTGARLRALLDGGRASEGVVLPLVGRVRVEDVGLPLFTVAVGLLDGFNPCATWILLLVLSLLVNVRDRARMLAVGGTFVAVSALVYYAILAAWLNLFLWVGLSRPTEVGLGVLALTVGTVNLRDGLVAGRHATFAIPEEAKPGIYARIRRVLVAESLGGAIAGIAIVALLVN